jgi:hypothetical protein
MRKTCGNKSGMNMEERGQSGSIKRERKKLTKSRRKRRPRKGTKA